MGRQFSFFLGPTDQQVFEDALRDVGELVVLKDLSGSPSPEEQPTTVMQAMGHESIRVLLARQADIPRIVLNPVRGRDAFYCDPTTQPIVEFDRCYVTERYINTGRLYHVVRYWGSGPHPQTKAEEFVKWAERLYRRAKKALTKVEQGYYAGEEAISMRRSGIGFVGLDIPLGSLRDLAD